MRVPPLKEYKIEINFVFSGLFDNPDFRDLTSIEIIDNGIGFNDECLERFNDIYDGSKNMNNKGAGRLQYLKSFKNAYVESAFEEDGKTFVRKFNYGEQFINTKFINFVDKKSLSMENHSSTRLVFSDFIYDEDKAFYQKHSIHDWKQLIISKYLLKLSFINIPFKIFINFKTANNSEQEVITNNDIPNNFIDINVDIPYLKLEVDAKDGGIIWHEDHSKSETLHIRSYRLQEDKLDKNEISFYGNRIKVSNFSFPELKNKTVIDGHRFITGIYGDVLDKNDNVNQTRTAFTIPFKSEFEKQFKMLGMPLSGEQSFIFFDTIEEKVKSKIGDIYPEFKKAKEEQEGNINELVKAFYFSDETVKATKFDIGDRTEEQILTKLYKTETDSAVKKDAELHRIITSIKSMNPNDADYQAKLEGKSKDILSIIPEQNKRSLSKYIARREIVAHLLGYILGKETGIQKQWEIVAGNGYKNREASIHNLIFKKNDAGASPNDLWLLNEEFVHFKGASNERLTNICYEGEKLLRPGIKDEDISKKYLLNNQDESRPDILLFPEEEKIIIIEFKNEDVELTQHLEQIPKYAKLIANCISPRFKVNQFYGFLIGEKINQYAMEGFIRTYSSNQNMWFKSNSPINHIETQIPLASLYYEVIKLSELQHRALLRNKSFADRLGIRRSSSDTKT
jgi:hypothetical protein